jgi:hypothetical protein
MIQKFARLRNSRRFLAAIVLLVTLVQSATLTVAGDLTFDAAVQAIARKKLRAHVEFLASDTLEGREGGTEGGYAAASYIVQELKKHKLKPSDEDGDYFQYFNGNFRNILAVVPGSDQQLKNEYILIGAHYDHVGYGTNSNSRGPIGYVHNGADDNASGTSGLLEVAKSIAALKTPLKRSVLIAFWDSEEKGLLGSKLFVKQPTVDLKQIKLAINADMIGRLRPTSFEFYGWRTALGLRDWATQQNTSKLHIKFTYEYRADSDHWPFFERGIPSVMIHTGRHADYHKPSDDVDKVNYAGIEQVSRYFFRLVTSAANDDDLPKFRRKSSTELTGLRSLLNRVSKRTRPPRLGISYNAELSEKRIVKITLVRDGSPAGKAGLKVGDEIVSFAGHLVKDFEDFNTLVVTAQSPAKVVFKRDDKEQEASINLNGKPVQIGIQWQTDDAEPNRYLVTEVVPGSPAEVAGLAPGQRIQVADGKTISTSDELKKLILESPNPVALVVEDKGNIKKLSLTRIKAADAKSEDKIKPK